MKESFLLAPVTGSNQVSLVSFRHPVSALLIGSFNAESDDFPNILALRLPLLIYLTQECMLIMALE